MPEPLENPFCPNVLPMFSVRSVTYYLRIAARKSGAPWVIRTPDLLVRSQTLYPAELRARRSLKIVAQLRDPTSTPLYAASMHFC